ncbi:hypothetical protein PIROE2DRAFT_13589, partial [Piromyces sp. E2]
EEFKKSDTYVIGNLYNDKAIFLKYWDINALPIYKKSILPGKNEGISASCVGGYNIALCKYSNKEKQDAALKVIEYITSKEVQKETVMNNIYLSGISSLYEDKDVCNKLDCELYKSIQLVNRPITKEDDYDDYSSNFKNKIYEYIFGNKTAKEALQNAVDITKIYTISLNSNESSLEEINNIINVLRKNTSEYQNFSTNTNNSNKNIENININDKRNSVESENNKMMDLHSNSNK